MIENYCLSPTGEFTDHDTNNITQISQKVNLIEVGEERNHISID